MRQVIISPIEKNGKVGPQILKTVMWWDTFLDRTFFLGSGFFIGLLIGWAL